MMLAATLDAVPGVRAKHRGRLRQRPDRLHADKGYDHRHCRRECRARGIKFRIARRGIESSQRLGQHRWMVERTFNWLNQFRRLTVLYERRADLHLALTTLACAIITCGRSGGFVLNPKGSTVWSGCKVHLTETCDDGVPNLITNVETMNATVSDGRGTLTIHTALEARNLLPKTHIADTGFVNSALFVDAREHFGIDLIGPTRADR